MHTSLVIVIGKRTLKPATVLKAQDFVTERVPKWSELPCK
jgi:hypothetical protein